MKVTNVHSRVIPQPVAKVAALLATLAGEHDKVWPMEHWPRMKLDKGLVAGSKGGHGPIRYTVSKFEPGRIARFEFSGPKGFLGHHRFELSALGEDRTELKHVIEMKTSGIGTISWSLAYRWLHDALVEDALDKVENHFSKKKKKTEWSLWVKVLRWSVSPRRLWRN